MRNRLIAAILVCSGLATAAPAASAESHHKGQKKVLVCKDTRASNNKGTVIGAVGGGLLGNVVAGHGHKTAGTVIGAGVGAVAGHEVARRNNEKNRDCHYEYR
jgi:uncharacterized protein YcfJ